MRSLPSKPNEYDEMELGRHISGDSASSVIIYSLSKHRQSVPWPNRKCRNDHQKCEGFFFCSHVDRNVFKSNERAQENDGSATRSYRVGRSDRR
jgi:hypothetical protein